VGEYKAFICQNSSCRKSFTTPLKTLNLKENPTDPYYACPFCLTKLEIELPKKEEEKVSSETVSKKKSRNSQAENKEKNRTKEKPPECHLHLGYLSERSSKEQIPDGCLVCKDIVECMLKEIRD
jgi:hypothetical protein